MAIDFENDWSWCWVGATVLVRVVVLGWGREFMVGMGWEGREDGKQQKSDDSK